MLQTGMLNLWINVLFSHTDYVYESKRDKTKSYNLSDCHHVNCQERTSNFDEGMGKMISIKWIEKLLVSVGEQD